MSNVKIGVTGGRADELSLPAGGKIVQNILGKCSSRGVAEMKDRATVRVYSFRAFDLNAKEMRVAKFKAERETIVSRFGGQVLERTGEDVAPTELDQYGRFRRIATAWGELG